MNPFAPTDFGATPARPRERGAVLIVALVLLIVLTLLALASMNTTALDEKMAANAQQSAAALQAAETGLTQAFGNTAAFDLNAPWTSGATAIPNTGGTTTVTSRFQGASAPPPGSLFSATKMQAYHFDLESKGSSPGGVQVVLHGGVYQIGPKSQ